MAAISVTYLRAIPPKTCIRGDNGQVCKALQGAVRAPLFRMFHLACETAQVTKLRKSKWPVRNMTAGRRYLHRERSLESGRPERAP